MALHTISLCAGIGGIDLGLRLAGAHPRTICYVEREATVGAILASRFADGSLDEAPIWSDLCSFDGRAWRGLVDCIVAGYPCQPFSIAGRRKGAKDPRHLWPEVARIIGEAEPKWVFLENVAGHLRLGFREVVRELQRMGARVAAGLFTAQEIGAPHRRQRLFALAYFPGRGRRVVRQSCGESGLPHGRRSFLANPSYGLVPVSRRASQSRDGSRPAGSALVYSGRIDAQRGSKSGLRKAAKACQSAAGSGEVLADSSLARPPLPECAARVFAGTWEEGRAAAKFYSAFCPGPDELDEWREVLSHCPQIEPAICGDDDGIPHRVDELRALGNSVVPLVAAHAWRRLRAHFEQL